MRGIQASKKPLSITRVNITFLALLTTTIVACGSETIQFPERSQKTRLPHPLTQTYPHTFDYIRRTSVTPVYKEALWWQRRHARKSNLAAKGDAQLVMIGDSLVHNFETRGHQIYHLFFGRYKPLNLGFNADLTQHALWRLKNGELDGLSPKVAVIMIGTNNTGRGLDAAHDTAEGIGAIVDELREQLPCTRILLLGIFPRGPTSMHRLRRKNGAVNRLLPGLADNNWVFYSDISEKFVDASGRLHRDIMYDFLHPTVKGYQIWAESISPTVIRLISDAFTPAECPSTPIAAR